MTDILNELLALEHRSLCARLIESAPYISQPDTETLSIAKRMAQTDAQHAALLVKAILDRGGSPGPRINDTRSGDLHFQDLRCLMPRLADERKRLIEACTRAAQRVSGDAEAAALISSIAEHHREELGLLEVGAC